MIAVISDSHIGRKAEEISQKILDVLERSDLIVHCGDFETEEVYEELQKHGEMIAVMGNCDRFELEDYRSFEREGIEFGVTHGKGIHPRGHHPTLKRIADEMGVEVLFHGHTHQQEAIEYEGTVFLNPGSCTGAPGGTYSGGNPEMMTVDFENGRMTVQMMELVDGKLEKDTKEFDLRS